MIIGCLTGNGKRAPANEVYSSAGEIAGIKDCFLGLRDPDTHGDLVQPEAHRSVENGLG